VGGWRKRRGPPCIAPGMALNRPPGIEDPNQRLASLNITADAVRCGSKRPSH